MAPARLLLDKETKALHRQEALRQYAEKYGTQTIAQFTLTSPSRNSKKLRGSARERMQRLRTQPPSKEQKERKAMSAAKYRQKNKESIREADAARRARNSNVPVVSSGKAQVLRKPKARLPKAPCLLPAKSHPKPAQPHRARWIIPDPATVTYRVWLPEEMDSSDDEDSGGEAISAGEFYRKRAGSF
ncbi:hypothetical protein B0H15DRAFT_805152 [Mycena belliarum]|uniref:Uncharacterized protein n=1 Tax=Mycena belliarum TaxID=1033014 RepID=A0AAD6TTW9_9AGAR|nr:hypothetical protein B0H15DRAFT_805152 [Mycena belliae]